MTGKGPMRTKLDQYLHNSESSLITIDAAMRSWQRHGGLLRRIATDMKRRHGEIDEGLDPESATAHAAKSGFMQSHNDLLAKADVINSAYEKLKDVHAQIQHARTQRDQMDQDFARTTKGIAGDPGNTPPAITKYPPTEAEKKAGKKYDHDKSTWDGATNTREVAAQRQIEALDRKFAAASAAFRKIHGEKPEHTGSSGGDHSTSVSRPDPVGPPTVGRPPISVPPPGTDPHRPGYNPPPVHHGPPVSEPPGAHPPHVPAAPGPHDPGQYDPGRFDGNVPGAPGSPGAPGVPSTGAPSVAAPSSAPGVAIPGVLSPGLAGRLSTAGALPFEEGQILGGVSRTGVPGVIGQGTGARTGGVAAGGRGGTTAGRGGSRGAGARGAGAGAGAGGRGRGKGKRDRQDAQDMWDDGEDWIDDEGAGPSVID